VAGVGQRYATPGRSAEEIAERLCLAGTPEDCLAGIQARIAAGTRDFVLGFLAADDDRRLQQMELFAKQVLPYVGAR
jgi:alkanesulfonate monooxygenase SsuD/methylene tetrahydromethanopterin reductase-like flavin-dependent oxidoreductase (luciferase family)